MPPPRSLFPEPAAPKLHPCGPQAPPLLRHWLDQKIIAVSGQIEKDSYEQNLLYYIFLFNDNSLV